MSKTRDILDRYERMLKLAAEKYSEDTGAQYAYMTGSLISEIRFLAYRYPQVADDIDGIIERREKQYVVDVLRTDANV